MRELRPHGDITDRIDVRNICLHLLIDQDHALRTLLNAKLLEAETLDIDRSSDCDKSDLCFDLCSVCQRAHDLVFLVDVHLFDPLAEMEFDPVLLHHLFNSVYRVLIADKRQHLRSKVGNSNFNI